jgi:hypothetical protein
MLQYIFFLGWVLPRVSVAPDYLCFYQVQKVWLEEARGCREEG